MHFRELFYDRNTRILASLARGRISMDRVDVTVFIHRTAAVAAVTVTAASMQQKQVGLAAWLECWLSHLGVAGYSPVMTTSENHWGNKRPL